MNKLLVVSVLKAATCLKLLLSKKKPQELVSLSGTSLLPPHMDLLNVNRDAENIEPSTPLTNGRAGQTRESSPASSSTLSHNNEDSNDIPDLAPVSNICYEK